MNDLTLDRTFTLGPAEVVGIQRRMRRTVSVVTATVDGKRQDSTACVLGSGPDETALIEVGNGLVSVTEGRPRVRTESLISGGGYRQT